MTMFTLFRKGFTKKVAVLLDFVQMRRGGRALPKFFGTFSWVHFWSIKGVSFFQNGNNLNLDIVIVISIAINAQLSDLSNDQLIFDMMKDLPNYLFWQHFPEPRSHFSGNYTPAAKRSPAFINFNNSKFFILDKSYKYFQRQAPKMPERCLIFHTLSIVETGFYFTEDLDMWTVCVQGGPSLEPSKYN